MSNDVTSMLRVNNFEMISPRIALLLTFSFVNSFHSSCLGAKQKKANCARIEKPIHYHMRSHPKHLENSSAKFTTKAVVSGPEWLQA